MQALLATLKIMITKLNQSILTHADLVAERHASYVNQFVTRANDELYAILAEILKLYEQIEASKQRNQLIKAMRKQLREVHSIKTQANTKTTALVTKYVTRASRKTAHVYSRVLDQAISQGIGSSNLVAFIKQRGGIDKLRQRVVSAEVAKQHSDRQRSLLKAMRKSLTQQHGVATVNFGSRTPTLPTASDVTFDHLLCHFNHATQQHEIVAVLYPSSTLENMAIDQFATMITVAARSDDHGAFYDQCKQLGLNMDITLRWMSANNIADAAVAKALALKIANLAQIPTVKPAKAANSDRHWPKAA